MTDKLHDAESRLFDRMFKNSVVGFIKGAAVGIAVGAAIGALVFGMGLLSASILPTALLDFAGSSGVLAGAMIGASLCLLPAGRIGQIAGVQSTRDARRYLLAHEARRRDSLLPPEQDPLRDVNESAVAAMDSPARNISYRDQIIGDSANPSSTLAQRR